MIHLMKKKKLKYRNWNQNQSSIFHELDKLQPEGIVSTIGADYLAARYLIKYGDKPVPEKIQEMSNAEVAELLAGIYGMRWTKLLDLAEEIAYYSDFDTETIIEETNLDRFTKSILSENVNKVVAFDSDMFSDDSSGDNTLTENNNQDRNKLYSKKSRSIHNVDMRRRMIDNSNISEILVNDVMNIVSLPIY